MSANHACSSGCQPRGTCAWKRVHRISSSAMCSEGAWLNGLSKLPSTSNSAPKRPPVSGRSKVKRSGKARKHAIAMACAVRSRLACASSSRRVVQRNSETAYSRSIDQ